VSDGAAVIGVPREVRTQDGATRVAATSATVRQLLALGHGVGIERYAGRAAGFDE
jgi:NAD/NADP transhydrogenase alpha subunit